LPSTDTRVQWPCQWRWRPSAVRRRREMAPPSSAPVSRKALVERQSTSNRKSSHTASRPLKRSATNTAPRGVSIPIRRSCCEGKAPSNAAGGLEKTLSMAFDPKSVGWRAGRQAGSAPSISGRAAKGVPRDAGAIRSLFCGDACPGDCKMATQDDQPEGTRGNQRDLEAGIHTDLAGRLSYGGYLQLERLL